MPFKSSAHRKAVMRMIKQRDKGKQDIRRAKSGRQWVMTEQGLYPAHPSPPRAKKRR